MSGGIAWSRVAERAVDASLRWRDDQDREVVLRPRLAEDVAATDTHAADATDPVPSQTRTRRAVRGWAVVLGGFALLVASAWLFSGIIIAGTGISRWVVLPGMILVILALQWVQYRFAGKRVRRAQAISVIPMWLANGLCPACGYDLVHMTPDGDGVRTCAECGAAWNPEKWASQFPFEFGRTSTEDLRVSGRKVLDARNRKVTLLAARSAGEARRAIRRAIGRALNPVRVIVIALILAAACVPALVFYSQSLGDPRIALFVLAIAAVPTLALLAVGLFGSATHLLVSELTGEGRCAQCESELAPTPCVDEARVCDKCGAAWKRTRSGDRARTTAGESV